MVATLQSLDPEQRNLNLNMAVLNFTVYEYFRKIVVTGELAAQRLQGISERKR